MIVSEALAGGPLERRAEPPDTLQDPLRAAVFHCTTGITLPPVDHLNALAVSRLAPLGGLVMDLGAGSGRFLCHLARVRPDLRLAGVDRSREMVRLGQDNIRRAGLGSRITLSVGEMTEWDRVTRDLPDVLVSQFVLHSVSTRCDMGRLLNTWAAARRHGLALWAFDFIRPRRSATLQDYSHTFLRGGHPLHHDMTRHALNASWMVDEVRDLSLSAGLLWDGHVQSMGLNIMQALWAGPLRGPRVEGLCHLTNTAQKTHRILRFMFPGLKPFYS